MRRPALARWSWNFFSVHRFFHASDHAAWSMRLSLYSRNLTRFGQRFEMAKVLDNALLWVTISDCRRRSRPFPDFKFLKQRHQRPAISRRRLEHHFTGLL